MRPTIFVAHHADEALPNPAPAPLGFQVLDPKGVPIGLLSGWVEDSEGAPLALVVTLFRWDGDVQVYLPLGAVISVNTSKRRLRLHETTREVLLERCLHVARATPTPSDLADTSFAFPNPRPSVAERLSVLIRKAHLHEAWPAERWAACQELPSVPEWQPLTQLGRTG